MNRKLFALSTLSAAVLSLGACGGPDTPFTNEETGQSERMGIGVARQPLVTGPVSVDARRSLAVTEKALVNGFTLRAVLDRLASQSGVSGLTGSQLFKQLWDTQNPSPGLTVGPHCNDVPSVNGFPYRCRTADGAQAQNPDAEMDSYSAIGLFNRFDLAPANGADCGEYRMVFARAPSGARNFIIFEAVLANPRPDLGLEGCRPIAKFWSDLSTNTDVTSRKNALVSFYFNGLSGFMPVVHVENYGVLGAGRSTTGQVRTNQFLQMPWLLREFKLKKTCGTSCSMVFQPITDKTNPFGKLFTSGSTEPLAAEFQNTFFPSQVAALAVNDLNAFNYAVPDKFNTGESAVESFGTDDYDKQFSTTGTFASNIQAKLTQINSTLTPAQIVARAKALSCAGCHALSNNQPLGGGLTWPASLGFTHVSEQTEPGQDGERFIISNALTNVFLPQRKAVLDNFMNNTPSPSGGVQSVIQSGVAANRCLDVSGAGTANGTNVQLYQCNGTNAQRWMLTSAGELRSAVASGMCLDVSNAGTTDGTNVQIYQCNGTNAQKWTRTAAGELRSALGSNICLDVANAGTADGTNVQIYQCNGTKAQQWFEAPLLPNSNTVKAAAPVPITIRDVRLNGGSNTLVGASRGQMIQVAVDYTITQISTCPSCIDQILIGLQTGPLGCVFDGIPSGSGTSGTGFLGITAPTTPGVYYLRFRYAQAFSCDTSWWTSEATPNDAHNIAVITVQ
ncbi:RICIN domain-containing protein [Archangium violaceum]|uniref:RICIN domain-containing protein n=1 Tax=Archangium violaceum TaxID=83451 RepID=UPI00195254B0|nr:RICIN domain-containing protein [Archangium violaceum]QRO01412.1 RICIN domain-containing protein [Archangium violaceum]